LGTRLVLVARKLSGGIDEQCIGADDAILQQRGGGGLSVELGLLSGLKVLVDVSGLAGRAVGIEDQGDIHLHGPSATDSVDVGSARVLGGNYGMDVGGLVDVLNIGRGFDIEGFDARERDILRDGCGDGTVRGVDVSRDLEVVGRLRADRAAYISSGPDVNVFGVNRRRGGEGIFGEGSGDLGGTVIEIEEQRGGSREIIVGVVDAKSYGVRLTIVENAGEGREVDAIRFEVQRLHAGNRDPEEGIDASGVDPGIDGSDSGGITIDCDFRFAEGGAAAAFEFGSNVVGNAGVPELVAGLALGENIKEKRSDVSGQRQSLFEQAGGAAESDGATG